MQFKSLSIKNIGQFHGYVKFDLQPKGKNGEARPIILFGGKNGTGKTTFLQAIKLCLYGNLSFGLNLSKKQYESSLKNMIHNPKSKNERILDAETKLEFYYSESGRESLYEITRSWTVDSVDNIREKLILLKEDRPLKEITKAQWQDFINSIIPLPLSSLFFFDGEQIQYLADTSGHEGLSNAVNKLLGLDLVEKLRYDLDYLLSEERKNNPDHDNNQMTDIEKQIDQAESELATLSQERASLNAKTAQTQEQLVKIELDFKNKGGTLAEMREENMIRQAELETIIKLFKSELEEIAGDIFPFCIIPGLMNDVKSQLVKDNEIKEQKALKRFFKQEMRSHLNSVLNTEVFDQTEKTLTESQRNTISNKIYSSLSKKIFVHEKNGNGTIIHDFSAQQEQRFLEVEKEVRLKLPDRIKKIGKKLDSAEKEWQQTMQMVLQAPDEHDVQGLIDQLKQHQNKLSNFDNKLKKCTELKTKLEYHIEELKRTKKRLEADLIKNDKNLRNLELILKSNELLEVYQEQLKRKKILLLESEFLDCWQKLTRKSDLISYVRIDPTTFEVTLYEKTGYEKNKDLLSAGEKQIYAVAMLWSLGRISGRPLPVIIDTPLGRLDSDHRVNLIENYFPYAGHQVVILSTDTELDHQYYQMLEPSVSHAYHLKYNSETKQTNVDEGYFW
jgi:DNA sulfur modification protein DndD